HGQVQAGAGADKGLNLWIRLRAAQDRIELCEDDLWHRQPKRPADLAREELGDEHFRPLTRPAEFQYIRAKVVRLDDRRKRSTFAQRSRVPGHLNCSHLRAPTIGQDGTDRGYTVGLGDEYEL